MAAPPLRLEDDLFFVEVETIRLVLPIRKIFLQLSPVNVQYKRHSSNGQEEIEANDSQDVWQDSQRDPSRERAQNLLTPLGLLQLPTKHLHDSV